MYGFSDEANCAKCRRITHFLVGRRGPEHVQKYLSRFKPSSKCRIMEGGDTVRPRAFPLTPPAFLRYPQESLPSPRPPSVSGPPLPEAPTCDPEARALMNAFRLLAP